MPLKTCNLCKEAKPLTAFSKNAQLKSGLQNRCKACTALYYRKNATVIRERSKAAREHDPPALREWKKQYYKKNREAIKEKTRAYYTENQSVRLAHAATYRAANRGKINDYKRTWGKTYRKRPGVKVRNNISHAVSRALRTRGLSKNGQSFFAAVGYTVKDLMQHLTALFLPGMTWENYGSYWQVDHIKAQCFFVFESMDDPVFKQCWALENLRPLESRENSRLGGRLSGQRLGRLQEGRRAIPHPST